MTNPALEALSKLWDAFPQDYIPNNANDWYDTIQSALANAPQWLPIETAPKDGTSIYVSDGSWSAEAFWDSDEYDELKGFYTYVWNYGPAIVDPTNFNPTHWMPLPAAPNGGAE